MEGPCPLQEDLTLLWLTKHLLMSLPRPRLTTVDDTPLYLFVQTNHEKGDKIEGNGRRSLTSPITSTVASEIGWFYQVDSLVICTPFQLEVPFVPVPLVQPRARQVTVRSKSHHSLSVSDHDFQVGRVVAASFCLLCSSSFLPFDLLKKNMETRGM